MIFCPPRARGARPRAGRPPERGAGTALTAIVLMFVVGAASLAVVIAGWIGSVHAARSDADLAALAGAAAFVRGQDACSAAARSAGSNGARLLTCSVAGDVQAFAVHVRVVTPLRPAIRLGAKEVGADAVAGSGMH